MTIKTFDKDNLRTLRLAINSALAAVEKEHGIALDLGAIRYDAKTFTVKLTATITDSNQSDEPVQSAQERTWSQNFKDYAFTFGMKPEDLGKTVVLGGDRYVIAGARPKANAPIVLRTAKGKYIAYSAEPVRVAVALVK